MLVPTGTWTAVIGHDSHQAEVELLLVGVGGVLGAREVRIAVAFGPDGAPEDQLTWRQGQVTAVREEGNALVVEGSFPFTDANLLRLTYEVREDRWTKKLLPVLVLLADGEEYLLKPRAEG